jgi:hypothetical protein
MITAIEDPRLHITLPVLAPTTSAATERRQCAGCTVCFVALTINDPELVAPAGEACPHLAAHGCSIHGGNRPRICGEYVCHYLMEERPLDVDDRPDRTGAIVGLSPAPLAGLPFECFVHIVEHRPEGTAGVLARPAWRAFLGERLRAGFPIHINRWNDPRQEEAALLRWDDGRMWMRPQLCDAEGKVVVGTLTPTFARALAIAVDHADWGYPFEARALRQRLGTAPGVFVRSSSAEAGAQFRITRWQAEISVALERLLRLG